MKKQFALLVTTLFFAVALKAQNNITMLHHGGIVSTFSGTIGFVNAYNAASTGDTIYLGGGIFTTPTTYNKGLIVFGAGYNIDSSIVTGATLFTGGLNIYEGGDNSKFHGINMAVWFYNTDIDNVAFNYCKFTGISYTGIYTAGSTCDNNQYIRCHLAATADFNTTNFLLLQNCLINYQVKNIHENGLIDHCIITFSPSPSSPLDQVSNSVISNSKFSNAYFFYAAYITNGTNNLFTHNAFNTSFTDATNTFTGNYYGVVDATFFVDPINYNYHLQSPGSYPGTDGDQICLYGGDFAWKDGSIPGNPHISFKNIGATSNEDGTLDVEIKVTGQDN